MSDFDGRAYQARFDALARQGMDVHGEATLVRSFAPSSVLDAGCGTGRVAIELARDGIETVGVDVDESMITEARRRAPTLAWLQADLCKLDLRRSFDVIVLAGNVPLFCPPASRPGLVGACAAHLAASGVMVAGFQLDQRYDIDDYDGACTAAGLVLRDRWSTWDRKPFSQEANYAVSVHGRELS
jgi:2-polyprenyl-3-methyl-5-hydroxy-6-metoxy-1,4-benzoquinol methylase